MWRSWFKAQSRKPRRSTIRNMLPKEGAAPNRKPQITAELLDPCVSLDGSAAAMNRSVQFQGHWQVHGQVGAFRNSLWRMEGRKCRPSSLLR
jgi:hypothetical protein